MATNHIHHTPVAGDSKLAKYTLYFEMTPLPGKQK
jgi:hypothetical protein